MDVSNDLHWRAFRDQQNQADARVLLDAGGDRRSRNSRLSVLMPVPWLFQLLQATRAVPRQASAKGRWSWRLAAGGNLQSGSGFLHKADLPWQS